MIPIPGQSTIIVTLGDGLSHRKFLKSIYLARFSTLSSSLMACCRNIIVAVNVLTIQFIDSLVRPQHLSAKGHLEKRNALLTYETYRMKVIYFSYFTDTTSRYTFFLSRKRRTFFHVLFGTCLYAFAIFRSMILLI